MESSRTEMNLSCIVSLRRIFITEEWGSLDSLKEIQCQDAMEEPLSACAWDNLGHATESCIKSRQYTLELERQ